MLQISNLAVLLIFFPALFISGTHKVPGLNLGWAGHVTRSCKGPRTHTHTHTHTHKTTYTNLVGCINWKCSHSRHFMTYFRLITLGEFTLDPVVFLVHSFAANLARLLKFVFGITCSLYDYIYIFFMSVDPLQF